MRHRPSQTRRGGFTLIELLVTLSIGVVIAGMAYPSFSGLIGTMRAKTVGTDLYAALLRARSEAIKRNASVTLSPVSGAWTNGWSITDPASGNAIDAHAATRGVSITGPTSVTYGPAGRSTASAAASFAVAVSSGGGNASCVSVSLSGQPLLNRGSSC
ncbi:GspH/FimT family pseudopilin [Noviherbaspirillum pedocola]|uniref:Type II secretion system protein H n=1 Tax=Noviherbaspirillum pedocola TaxID=2801341 RepID=A0A934STP3_9BURK|nr:GspH/FimT family pseudopilin [Noviherbaspirillum pedocola]MBK4735018.1 GspH/FimT family pseudopilin [Noviherbaspirillum pedocola]